MIIFVSLYQYYAGRGVTLDTTDVQKINSVLIGLSGDWMSVRFLKIDGKIPDGIQDYQNINKTFLSKITTAIMKVAEHNFSESIVYCGYFKQMSNMRLA